MRKIKKGDTVVVLAGRDKGKRGDVAQVVDAEHVIVNGVNAVKRASRDDLRALGGGRERYRIARRPQKDEHAACGRLAHRKVGLRPRLTLEAGALQARVETARDALLAEIRAGFLVRHSSTRPWLFHTLNTNSICQRHVSSTNASRVDDTESTT